MRKICLLLIVLLLACQVTTVFADDTCTLRIEYIDENTPMPNVEFRIYHVAEILSSNYTLVANFANSNLELGSQMTNSEWTEAANILVGYVHENNVIPNSTGKTDSNGVLEFSGLYSGLYLVEGNTFSDGRQTKTAQAFCVVLNEKLVTVTPKYETTQLFGHIIITKTVTGKDADYTREWHFRVTLDKPLSGIYGDMTFKEGKAEFILKHGESITGKNLPAGISYTVEELDANMDKYMTTSENEKGVIIANQIVKVDFVNKYNYTPQDSPGTGDNSNIELWVVLCCVALTGIISSMALLKKKAN